jgi:hypothetical protein
MGCRPASAAPTVRPAKPDSVMGLSITLFSPKRSRRPLVTLYLQTVSATIYFRVLPPCRDVSLPNFASFSCSSHTHAAQLTWCGSNIRSVVLRNLLTEHEDLVVPLHLLGHGLVERLSHRHLLLSRGISSSRDRRCDSCCAESWSESGP